MVGVRGRGVAREWWGKGLRRAGVEEAQEAQLALFLYLVLTVTGSLGGQLSSWSC